MNSPLSTFMCWLLICQLTVGRDLHLTTGQVLNDFNVSHTQLGEITVRHKDGVMTIPYDRLSYADQMELDVKPVQPATLLADQPATPSLADRNYGGRDYANRDYSARTKDPQSSTPRISSFSYGSRYTPSNGGTVYVRSYVKKDGTFVHAHTRRK